MRFKRGDRVKLATQPKWAILYIYVNWGVKPKAVYAVENAYKTRDGVEMLVLDNNVVVPAYDIRHSKKG